MIPQNKLFSEQYSLDITGLEPQRWLISKAIENLKEKARLLKGSAQFVLMEHPAHLNQFPDESFDIIISKESILHVPLELKKAFFLEIARVLKPGGQLIVMDWMHTVAQYSQKTQKMMDMDGEAYHLITPLDYQSMLIDGGFSNVEMEDLSLETANFSQGNIDKIKELSHIIEEKYGRNMVEYCIESWGYQKDAFASKELVAAIFRAEKGCSEK
jgi:ubiquinone/menaquinone biosynthesis C-methylase UbiE